MSRLYQNLRALKLLSGLLAVGLLLTACGESTPAKPTQDTDSNEWDTMTWDQSTWG